MVKIKDPIFTPGIEALECTNCLSDSKLKLQDDQIKVNEYEELYNRKIQIIYKSDGTPCFPDENRILKKNEALLINEFKREG